MNFQAPSLDSATSVFPVMSRPSADLAVYSGFPDEQPWLEEALLQASICGAPLDVRGVQEFGALAWGAPLGPDDSESQRVARCTGVVTEGDAESKIVTGAALAHARCLAYWHESEEGPVLRMEFQAPTCFGWGTAKDRLSQEQLKAVCLHQLRPQSQSILENVADAEQALRLEVHFTGAWDESAELIQRRLTQHCLKAWQEVTRVNDKDSEVSGSTASDEAGNDDQVTMLNAA